MKAFLIVLGSICLAAGLVITYYFWKETQYQREHVKSVKNIFDELAKEEAQIRAMPPGFNRDIEWETFIHKHSTLTVLLKND